MPTILKSTRKGKRSTLKNGVDFSMYQEKQRWFEQTAKRDQETKNKSVSFLGFSWKIGLELACEQQTHFLSSTTGNASAVRRLVWRMEPTCEGIGKREAVVWGERGGGGGGDPVLSMSVPSKPINLCWPWILVHLLFSLLLKYWSCLSSSLNTSFSGLFL